MNCLRSINPSNGLVPCAESTSTDDDALAFIAQVVRLKPPISSMLVLRCKGIPRSLPFSRGLSSSSPFHAEYLKPCEANYTQLSPLSFLRRAAKLYPDKVCYYVHDRPILWPEANIRILKFASALIRNYSIHPNDVVSTLCPNSHIAFELHFSIPGIRAILHSINTRLDDKSIAFQLQHAGTKVLIIDEEYLHLGMKALSLLPKESRPKVIRVQSDIKDDSLEKEGLPEFEEVLQLGTHDFQLRLPLHEFDAMTLNYTSKPPAIRREW